MVSRTQKDQWLEIWVKKKSEGNEIVLREREGICKIFLRNASVFLVKVEQSCAKK